MRSETMAGHVPVRFSAEMLAEMKRLAERDGRTLSGWIRYCIQREIVRQQDEPDRPAGRIVLDVESDDEIACVVALMRVYGFDGEFSVDVFRTVRGALSQSSQSVTP